MYSLKMTPAAEDDLDGIYAYIAGVFFDPTAAERIILRIEGAIMSLRNYPCRCEVSRDETLAMKGYRRLVVGNYVAIYFVDDASETVVIMRVFHGDMDYVKYV